MGDFVAHSNVCLFVCLPIQFKQHIYDQSFWVDMLEEYLVFVSGGH